MLKEFKEFIAKGNVLDLAIAVLIAGAFGLIVASFVKDIFTPVLGMLGKANFENMFVVLKEGTIPGPYTTPDIAQKAGAVTMNYGMFLNTVINFIIVAFALFMVVKAANRMKKPAPEAAPLAPAADIVLLTEIRDLLKK